MTDLMWNAFLSAQQCKILIEKKLTKIQDGNGWHLENRENALSL